MLCVLAKLSDEATAKLQALSDSVAELGFRPRRIYGHVTLATYLSGDEADIIAHCTQMLAAQKPMFVRYTSIDALVETNCIAAMPEKTRELTELQARISDKYAACLDEWTRADAWLPHTMLMYHPTADLEIVLSKICEHFTPFDAEIVSFDFSRVTDSGYEIVGSVKIA